MRLNHKFASTFLTGLFVTTCILTPAAAQEKSYQPQSAWALTKVDRSAQGGNSYCTLSRKYDENVVLSLGRNQTEEYSLAIDFQKPVFNRDKSVKINLQPGPGQIRAYDMVPTSEKAVVIRLGWDTGFFDTLNSSQNMKVKIGEQSYAFAMPEVAKGQSDLKDCMEDLKSASAKDSTPAATTDVLAAAPSASSNEFSAGKVEEKIAMAEAAKPSIAEQESKVLNNFANSIREQEPALRSADKHFAADQRQENPETNAAKREKTVVADAAPVPPQKPKAELVKRPPATEDSTKIASIMPAAGEDTAAAKAKAEKAVKQAEAAKQEAAKKEAELKTLQAKLKNVSEENNEMKQATNAEQEKLNTQVDTLQKRLADIAKENESLKKKSASVSPETQKQMKSIEVEKKELENRLVAAEQEKAKLSVQQMGIAERTKELETRNALLEQELKASQAQIAEATTLASNQKNEQLKTLQSRLSQIAAENEKLKEKSATLSPEAKKQMESIAAEKKSLEEKLAAAEKEKASLVPQQAFASAEAKAKAAAEENAKLQQSLSELRTKVDQSAKAQADAKALEERIAKIKIENESLKQKAEGISPEAQKKIKAAEAEKKVLEEKLAVAKTDAAKQLQTQKQMDAIAAEKKALEEKLAAEKKAAEEKLAAVKTEAGKQTDVQKQMDALKAEKKALEEQLVSANADAAKKAIEITAQAEEAKKLSSMTAMPVDEEQVAALEAEKKALQQKLADAEAQAIEAKDAAAKAAAAASTTSDIEKISELEIRNKQLEESLRASQTRISEAAINTESKALRKIADLENKLDAAQKDNSTIAKQLEDYRTQQEDGRLSLVAGNWDLESATKRYNEAEREIRRLGQEVEKERTSCNVEKAEIEQMLFDPAVTDQKQIEKLRALEAEIADLKAGRGDSTQTASAGPVDRSVEIQSIEPAAGSPEDFGNLSWSSKTPKKDLGTDAAAQKASQENARLRAETERLRQQLANAEQGVAQASGTAQSARERSETERLKRQLARAQTQSATYQNQLARAQATPEATAQDEHLLAQNLNQLQPTSGSAMAPKQDVVKSKAETAGYSPANIKTLLQKAGVSASGLKKASGGMSGADNFAWSPGAGMKGLASVKKGGSFDGQVQQYLDQQKSACKGDFASMPSPSTGGGKKMSLYEVACVSGSGSTSNSIVFFEDQGKFVAIANQTDAADMDAAMDSRDKIAAAVGDL